MAISKKIASLEEVSSFAKTLAPLLKKGDVITLTGDLGAGKTAFCRCLIRALSDSEVEVVSPTFMLVQTYPCDNTMIWHFDLYRLTHPDEIYEVGLEEALDEGITLIEWPQICAGILPQDRLEIEITIKNNDERLFTLTPKGSWVTRLENI